MGPGDVVAGRYRLERELGRGGMGAVYLARDEREGGREVALKVTAAAGHAHDAVKARFEREARIGCALGVKPGFVRSLDWGELGDGRTLWMAMALVRGARPLDLTGGTLDERLGRLEEAAALVERLHAVGVVHRDLKPANVLVDDAGRPWLADFGLAKVLGATDDDEGGLAAALTQTGMGMGTPQFMPPEQFEDAKSADARADVYALGVMLFVALTGQFPYDGRSAAEVLTKVMRARGGEAPAPRARSLDPGVSIGLDALAAEATALDRDRRTSSAAVFLAALRRARASAGRRSARLPGGATPAPGDAATAVSVAPAPAAAPAAPAAGPPGGAARPPVIVAPPPDEAPATDLLRRLDPLTLGVWAGRHLGRAGSAAVAVCFACCVLGAARWAARPDPIGHGAAPPWTRDDQGPGREALEREAREDLLALPREAPAGEDADARAVRVRAERGDPAAMLELARRLDAGRGVGRDRAAALTWVQRAANRDSLEAHLELARRYVEGDGVSVSEPTAMMHLDRAVALGSDDAAIQLEALRQKREGDDLRRAADAEAARQRQREEYEERQRRQREEYEARQRQAAEERRRRQERR